MRNIAGYKLQVEGDGLPVIPPKQSAVIPAAHTAVIPACPESAVRKDSRQAGVTHNLRFFLLCPCFIALLFCLVMVSLSNHAFAFKLPDTGQTKCYQSVSPYAEIPCAGTGQDGAYNINPMSFTDNGGGTVTDNNTGLMWQKQDDWNIYNWYQASGTYDETYNPGSTDVCGSLVLGGHSDWRLPAKKELMSIVDYSIPYPGPAINTAYFPNTKSSVYWLSTTHDAYLPSSAWCVFFDGGQVKYGSSKTNNYYVRCVRGGQYPAQSFTYNSNGTVTDNNTGLMWQQGETVYMTWDSALSYCEGLSLGGNTDWRLPNIKELESLTDDTRYYPTIDTTFFPGAKSSVYWSSTTGADDPGYSWHVEFGVGNVGDYDKGHNYYYVRCVSGTCTDNDSDGYGNPGSTMCLNGSAIDCNDNDASIRPGAPETCNNKDDDCDGAIDENLTRATSCGAGACASTGTESCTAGVWGNNTCVPGIPQTEGPLGDPTCSDGIDNDCDETTDVFDIGCGVALPDTGQTKCYRGVSPYDEIPCAGTGQDGAYNINQMSFTDSGSGTVTDNNTSLMWQKCSAGQNNDATCSGTAVTYNWYQASGTYDATYNPGSTDVCGNLVLGGHSDWRLPAKKELITIVDYAIPYPGPTINTTYFPNTKSSGYWSSTTGADYPGSAGLVDFYFGIVDGYGKDYGYVCVRCVRGGQSATSFTDNGNGTVTDNKTGLVWQQGEPGEKTWDSALSYCEGLSLGGSSDWRLPNIKELESITDDSRYNPAIDPVFTGTVSSYYWSSTTGADGPDVAWFVSFYYGGVYYGSKGYDGYGVYVRCVRGGQSGSFGNLGDMNNDDLIDISDVILVLRIALKLDPVKPCSDINNDGVVDISDVILTLRMALKLDPLQQCI